MARITVVGAGFVGLTTGVVFAEQGHRVRVVEALAAKLAMLEEGRTPFFEPGLEEAMRAAVASGRLSFSSELAEAVRESEFVFLCVGTPSAEDGSVELAYVRSAAEQVGDALAEASGACTVVVKSTVPPGTLLQVVRPVVESRSRRQLGDRLHLASNPEFLKEGMALVDARNPDRVVTGVADGGAARAMRGLYAGVACPYVEVDPPTAEMIKYSANSFLAVKIAFANEMANLCAEVGVDWTRVVEGIGHDARIGSLFLRAGIGFGGSCFPKDLAAISAVARKVETPLSLVDAALNVNARQPLVAVDYLEALLGSLAGKRVALLGLAFKPDTDDVRDTRALPVLRELQARGAVVRCYDPCANTTFARLAPDATVVEDATAALQGADGCIVATEWQEFRALKPADFLSRMRTPVVVDGRRALDAAAFENAGIRFRAIGLGRPGA